MKRIAIFMIWFVMVPVQVGGCDMTVKQQKASHQAVVNLPPQRYTEFVEDLDELSSSFDLKRVAAAPGLDRLVGRDVLYGSYVSAKDRRFAALNYTDIKQSGRVTIQIYGDYFQDEAQLDRFVRGVVGIVEKFGGKLDKIAY